MTDSSTQGHTRISLRTMEHIVTAAIASVPGTKAIEAKLAGIGGRGFPRVSVQMDSEREVAAVNATIGVVWPSPVTTVAEHTRAAISEAIAAHTGYSTTRVNVTVGGSVPGNRVTAAEVEQRQVAAAVAPHITPSPVWQPVTAESVNVRSIATPQKTPVRSVTAPDSDIAVRSVNTPREAEVRSVSADLPDHHLREISSPGEHALRPLKEPKPVHVHSVAAPRPAKLVPSGQVRPLSRKVQVSAPRPQPLRDIEIRHEWSPRRVQTPKSVPARKVQAPRPQALKRIEVTPANPRPLHVDVPRPEPLRAISINPYRPQGGNHG